MAGLSSTVRPLALGLAIIAATVAVVVPLVPEQYRLWNYALFGAVGLFAAARVGRWGWLAGLTLTLGAKFANDGLNYLAHGSDPQYLPFSEPVLGVTLYTALALYPILGWSLLRLNSAPLRIGSTALLGSVAFFLITNFASWLQQDLPYPRTLGGLLEAYTMGVPFWRGTLLSDLTGTGLLFGLNAALERVLVNRTATATISTTR